MKIFVPPIKCQGIKTKLVDWIVDHAQLDSNTHWIEPFMGSGVVGFNVRPKTATFCDVNPHIINFYNAIKSGEITSAIARTFLEKEGAILAEQGQLYFNEVRKRFNILKSPLDFLFLSRSSFNGVMRFNRKGEYNVPFGHKPERFAKAYVTKIVNQIDYVSKSLQQYDWNFVCQDFRKSIGEAAENDFIYCDPPYAGRHVDYFNSWTEDDEADLHQLLKETKAKFILSTWHSNIYRNNEGLEKLGENFEIYTREHFYHVGASEDNRASMTEALVLNYQSCEKAVKQKNEQLALLERHIPYKTNGSHK